MRQRINRTRLISLILMVMGVTVANYTLRRSQLYYEYFLQALYFVPLILAAFWFGLRGAITTSASITVLYLPFVLRHWKEFPPDELESLLELLIYNVVAGVLGLLRDREQERQKHLRESERLAAMGRALSSLAHDIKTPLIAIGGFTRLVLRRLPNEYPDREKLDIVVKETQRLEQMVRDMLDFSRNFKVSQADEDFCQIVKESLAVVEEIATEKNVRLENLVDKKLPRVSCDGMRMKQVLINLLTNAIDSSPEGSPVKVNAFRDKRGLVIDVVDFGAGIPPAQRPRIFDPFFTTKAHGTGLGLSIVKKIIDAHQGDLEILDNPDRGLTFRVVLPLVQETEPQVQHL